MKHKQYYIFQEYLNSTRNLMYLAYGSVPKFYPKPNYKYHVVTAIDLGVFWSQRIQHEDKLSLTMRKAIHAMLATNFSSLNNFMQATNTHKSNKV